MIARIDARGIEGAGALLVEEGFAARTGPDLLVFDGRSVASRS
jgi:hypothetical protein